MNDMLQEFYNIALEKAKTTKTESELSQRRERIERPRVKNQYVFP